MTDLVIWFGLWDDVIENLADEEAENLRAATKGFIRSALGFEDGKEEEIVTNPLICSFRPIADEACGFYSRGK